MAWFSCANMQTIDFMSLDLGNQKNHPLPGIYDAGAPPPHGMVMVANEAPLPLVEMDGGRESGGN